MFAFEFVFCFLALFCAKEATKSHINRLDSILNRIRVRVRDKNQFPCEKEQKDYSVPYTGLEPVSST